MDNETAQKLFEKGAMLLLLDVPKGTEIGVDMHSWQTDINFRGIKMIPPGLHFVYFSAHSNEGQLAPRTGFFHDFKEEEILVRRWDQQNEILSDPVADAEELDRYKSNKKDLDKFCGPYPYDSYKKWISLTGNVTAVTAQRVSPKNSWIQAASSLVSEASNSSSRAAQPKVEPIPQEKLNADNLMGHMKQSGETVMRYTEIHRFLKDSSAAKITECAVDSSAVLREYIKHLGDWQEVLSELQLSFVCFLVGQQYESFEQWKKCVALLCGCQAAVAEYEELFSQLVNVLHFQLKEMPEDFFVDIVSSSNFLTVTLHNLLANVSDSAASSALKSRIVKFGENLTRRFGWDFSSEPDDCSPVVVDEYGNY